MNTRNLILALTAGALVTASSGMILAGQQKPSTASTAKQQNPNNEGKAPKIKVSNGTITSMNESRLVISPQKKGKPEMTFTISAETMRRGEMGVGTPVLVHYRTQNNENLATGIQALAQRAQDASKTKPRKG